MALFLVIAGLTGMVLAFYWELDDWVNHDIMRVVPPSPDSALLSPLELREKVAQQFPGIWVNKVDLQQVAHHAATFTLRAPSDPQHQHITSFTYDEAFVNPYTGQVIAARKWGDISQGMINLIPFLYTLHFELALGDVGMTVFGVIALLWTLDCFVGAYLTFPASRKSASKHQLAKHAMSWSTRWKKAWQIRWNASTFKRYFDLHRAGGLWLWAMLLVFAWSSVSFNLSSVYEPVMRTIFKFQPADSDIPTLAAPVAAPKLAWAQALQRAEAAMTQQAQLHHFQVIRPQRLSYDPYRGVYQYRVLSSLDVNEKSGQTAVYLDADSGAQLAAFLPSRQAAGDTIHQWLVSLHTAKLWGVAYQIFVMCLAGAVVMLTLTGVYIWWKKHQAK